MTTTRPISKARLWLGLLRPRTLFSSLSAVLVAIFYAARSGMPPVLESCLLIGVALGAQISSNIANDLIDFKRGADTLERKGPLRPLSRGMLSERAVRRMLLLFLGLTLALGLWLIALSSWWLLTVALVVLLGVFAYSGAGISLAYRGLGDVAVLIFFGIVPVVVGYYILEGTILDSTLWHLALAIGLSNVNILVVNNYRDYAEDAQVGKRTLMVMMGRDFATRLYLSCGMLSMGLLYPIYSAWAMPLLLGYVLLFSSTYRSLQNNEGEQLNRTLAQTARNAFALSIMIGLMLLLQSLSA